MGAKPGISLAGIVGRACGIGVLAVAVIVAPNTLWLGSSTVRLQNDGAEAVDLRLAISDTPGGIVEIGRLGPGRAHFLFLEVKGEASLVVEIRRGDDWHGVCREYVEDAMYRVEVRIDAAGEAVCRTDLPLFNHLLAVDYLL